MTEVILIIIYHDIYKFLFLFKDYPENIYDCIFIV